VVVGLARSAPFPATKGEKHGHVPRATRGWGVEQWRGASSVEQWSSSTATSNSARQSFKLHRMKTQLCSKWAQCIVCATRSLAMARANSKKQNKRK
jgi:hypothetical protein